MTKFIYLLFLIFPLVSHGQDLASANSKAVQLLKDGAKKEAIDLLESEIALYSRETEELESLISAKTTLARSYIHNWESKKAEKNFIEAMVLSKEIQNDSLLKVTSFFAVTIMSFNGKYDTVSVLCRELLNRDDLSFDQESNANIYLSAGFEENEQLDSAIHYAMKAVAIDSINQDSSSLPYSYIDLGNYHISNLDFEKGIECTLNAISYLRPGKDDYKRVSMQITLGTIYYRIGNIIKAQQEAESALIYAIKYDLNKAQTHAYYLLGNCASYNDRKELALDYYMKSDSVNDIKIKNPGRAGRAKVAIFNTKLDLGLSIEPSEVEGIKELGAISKTPVLGNMISLLLLRIEENSIPSFERKFEQLYMETDADNSKKLEISLLQIKKEFYEKKGLYEKAYTTDARLDELKRETDQINNNFIIQELEAKYKRGQQDSEIKYLADQNSSKDQIVGQQRKMLIIGATALGLISLLSVFLFRLFSKVNKQKRIISKALNEKDILMREIHHRVKNNLQLVSSLLTLQGRSIDDETALQAINEGKSRVRSMALIHQDLYTEENLTGISVKTYLDKLSYELFTTYNIDRDRIVLEMNIQDMELDTDILVPLGLIINELVTNSLKYAFPGDEKGKLFISLNEIKTKLCLIVGDNGVGYDPRDTRANSFGTTLIQALTEQLEGEITTNFVDGTVTKILFENYSL